MPLTTRSVSPTELCVHRLPANIQQDELQCVTNGTLANLIRQLSSLSRHAEQMFTEIHRETLKIDHRANTLFLRVERLSQKVSQSQSNSNLRAVTNQASLEEAALRKAFKSYNIIDQRSLDRQTLPISLQEQYQHCDAPPQLNQLNPYREDDKEALRYYTDPGYFFELWRQEILKECGGGATSGEKKRTGRSPTSPSRQRRRQREQQNNFLPQNQQNALLNYHVSSRSSDYSRFMPSAKNKAQSQQFNNASRLPTSATEVFHFPAEYQAPQSLLSTGPVHHHPPPGMTYHPQQSEGANRAHQQQQQFAQESADHQTNRQLATANPPAQPAGNVELGVRNRGALEEHGDFGQQMQTLSLGAPSAPGQQKGAAGMAFLDDEDDELPPPPQAVLSSAFLAAISSTNSSASSPDGSSQLAPTSAGSGVPPAPIQFLPSGGTPIASAGNRVPQMEASRADEQQQQMQIRQKVPPPAPLLPSSIPTPPPPPPPPNFNMKAAAGEGNRTFGGEDGQKTLQRKPSNTSSNGTQDNRSQLLIQIQEGVKLKRVQQQEELAEKRAAATSNDVAAILRKRMEHCLGDSDSSSGGSPSAEDNEWDD